MGDAPRSVALGDLNADGRPDLAVANGFSDNVSVLAGKGDGTFQPAVSFATGDGPESVALGDVNGDGRPDLAVANDIVDNLSVLLGNGDGTFQAAVSFTTGSSPASVALGDVNRDGRPDLAVANSDSDDVSVLLNAPDPPGVNLAVTAAATPDPGASGQQLTYTLTVRSIGTKTATGVLLTDNLPDGVVIDGPATGSQGTCRGTDPAICDLGTLPSGAEASVTIDVIPTGAGAITNRATVSLNEVDVNLVNNSALTTTTVEPPIEPLTPRATCITLRCALRVTCNQAQSLGINCENDVTLFVRVPAGVRAPAGGVRGDLAARATRRIRFAAAITNIPPGQTRNVRLNLTRQGKRILPMLIWQAGESSGASSRSGTARGASTPSASR